MCNVRFMIADIGYSHLDIFTPAEVAQRAHRFLKPVCVHLEAISGFFQVKAFINLWANSSPVYHTLEIFNFEELTTTEASLYF